MKDNLNEGESPKVKTFSEWVSGWEGMNIAGDGYDELRPISKDIIDAAIEKYIEWLRPLPKSKPIDSEEIGLTIGKIISEAILLHELNPSVVEKQLGFPKGVIGKLMNDQYYTVSVPVVLFKNLIQSLHISFSKIEMAMMPTFKLMLSKETSESIEKKSPHYSLWENEECLNKYLIRLREIFYQNQISHKMKSSTECLFEYGINTMNINDEFNTAMFYAMEMYAEEYHLNEISKPNSEEIERMAEEKWISVLNGFPPIGNIVSVYVPTRKMAFMASRRDDGLGEYWNSPYYEIGEGVTHWQPLPAPPKNPS